MTPYILHNPASRAHLEDLKDRLSQSLAGLDPRPDDIIAATDILIVSVVQAVQAMEEGVLTLAAVRAVLSSFHLPGFCIERWVADMVEEGVYLENGLAEAA